jgi:hypothetical protein
LISIGNANNDVCLPFGATEAIVNLAKMMPLPKFDLKGTLKISSQGSRKQTSLFALPIEINDVFVKGPGLFHHFHN